jgi:hypothetical protein
LPDVDLIGNNDLVTTLKLATLKPNIPASPIEILDLHGNFKPLTPFYRRLSGKLWNSVGLDNTLLWVAELLEIELEVLPLTRIETISFDTPIGDDRILATTDYPDRIVWVQKWIEPRVMLQHKSWPYIINSALKKNITSDANISFISNVLGIYEGSGLNIQFSTYVFNDFESGRSIQFSDNIINATEGNNSISFTNKIVDTVEGGDGAEFNINSIDVFD